MILSNCGYRLILNFSNLVARLNGIFIIDMSNLVILLSLSAGETMVWKARNFGDRDLFQKAQNIRMPSCDALHELQAQAG